MSCPTGDLLTRAHLDAIDSFAPMASAGKHMAASYAWTAWEDVLAHRAECPHCRPGFPRPDGWMVL